MRKRSHLSRRKSRKLFSKTARTSHRRNRSYSPMRGGIRL